MRVVAAFLLAAHAASAQPAFTERAAELGIDHRYTGGWEHFVGGGVAVFDCDGDELPEIWAAGGAAPGVLLRNRSAPGQALNFAKDTPEELQIEGATGAYPLDIDSDGLADLVILRVGENVVLKGLGGCRFAPSPDAPRTGDRWTTAFSATWEAGAARPTMAFGHYVDRADPEGPFEACDDNHLARPSGDGWDVSTLSPGWCALSMLFSDWGRLGRADLRVSNDRHYYVRGGEEQLWAMTPAPRLYGAADGWRALPIWGMGIASRDIDRDGRSEIYLTSMGDQKLQRLAEGDRPTFLDAPYEAGATAHRPFIGDDGRPSTGWHAAFGDVDNDGFDDLFVAKGNVEQMPSNAILDPNNLLMGRAAGRFEEAGAVAGVASMARARGAALTDLNRDGRLDLVVANRNAPLEIFENRTKGGDWLAVTLRQPGANRNAVGAWIEVEANGIVQSREATVGGGHVSGWMGAHHFGLGEAPTARVRVIWPTGEPSPWREYETGQGIVISR